MRDGNPEVCAAIPFYARTEPAELEACVRSIVMQTYESISIQLAQDGPVGSDLRRLVESLRATVPRLTHREYARIGLPAILNCTIRNASAPYYARMDADDIASPDRIAAQVKYLEMNGEVGILGTWAREFLNGEDPKKGRLKAGPCEHRDIVRYLHFRNPIVHPSVMCRRHVLEALGGYDEAMQGAEDLDLWIRAAKQGVTMRNIGTVLMYRRIDGLLVRRRERRFVLAEARARMRHRTWSPMLNVKKVASIAFRLLPEGLQEWYYRRELRDNEW